MGKEIEVLIGMAIGGTQAMLFSKCRGALQGFPVVPVLKICGNPETCNKMVNDIDVNAGKIITGEKSFEEVGEEIFDMLIRVLSGRITKGEGINYIKSMYIFRLGPAI